MLKRRTMAFLVHTAQLLRHTDPGKEDKQVEVQ